jgi:GNAT superfamily N-acetyltransferase
MALASDTMGEIMAPKPRESCTYEPIDLRNEAECNELLRQRVICGWAYNPVNIEVWRKAIDRKEVVLFWVVPAHLSSALAPKRFAGHVGIENQCQPPEPDIARPDKTLLEISTLFILPEYRYLGLGRTAMADMEQYAKREPYGSPACKAVTIHTLSKRYWQEEGEDWRGMWARWGLKTPEKGASSNEEWYARMGYVKWKEDWRYVVKLLDGTEAKMLAVFMKKQLS